eukprot:2425584-Pyramimonas_sp.AAC.1
MGRPIINVIVVSGRCWINAKFDIARPTIQLSPITASRNRGPALTQGAHVAEVAIHGLGQALHRESSAL